MTIDEAIKHCEEVANQNEFETRIYDELNRASDEEYRNNHCQCAADHRQLADWLKELKERRTVKRGHWIEIDYGMFYECSECGNVREFERNFCSNCGADMRGDENA